MSRLNNFKIGDRVIFKFGCDFEKGTIIGIFDFGYEIEQDDGRTFRIEDDSYRRISLIKEQVQEKPRISYFRRLWLAIKGLDAE